MASEILKNALELTCTFFEEEDEDEPSVTYCLESWIPIVHLDTGEAAVWANTVKIVLGVRDKKLDTHNISYVALPPFVCSGKHRMSCVPREGFTFAYRDWERHDEAREPGEHEDYQPVFAKALALLGFRSGLSPVGFKFTASEERIRVNEAAGPSRKKRKDGARR